MEYKEFFKGLVTSMCAIMGVKMITAVLKFELVEYLKSNPMVKYRIDRFFYVFNVWFYYPFLSYVFPLYCILYSLFAPEYDALPRFTAAYIALVIGFASAITFAYLKRNLDPPIKPMEL
jgi:hypothetical protein